MARTISRCWGVSVGAAHTCEPRLSAALLALGKIFFFSVHGRRHPVDRQGRPVDIVSLPVNGQPVLVDMDIDAVNKKVCPVNMESSCRDANNACRQALSCGHANYTC